MTCGYRVFVCSNMAFAGDFTPVLAEHSKSLSLINCISVGVERILLAACTFSVHWISTHLTVMRINPSHVSDNPVVRRNCPLGLSTCLRSASQQSGKHSDIGSARVRLSTWLYRCRAFFPSPIGVLVPARVLETRIRVRLQAAKSSKQGSLTRSVRPAHLLVTSKSVRNRYEYPRS